MTETLLSIILIIVLILSYLERRDLQNRIMAGSLQDFKQQTQKEEKNEEPEPDDTIPLDQAYEQLEKDLNG